MLSELLESNSSVLNFSIIAAYAVFVAAYALEDRQQNQKIKRTEKSFAADCKQWVEVIPVKQFLFDHKLRSSESLGKK